MLRRQLAIARHGTRIAQSALAQRIRVLYDEGNVEPLEVIFGAKNLDEAMSSLDSLSRTAGQSEDILHQLQSARRQLTVTWRELATRESALTAETSSAEATATQLASARAARASYISSLALARQMTQRQLAAVVAQAHDAQVRSAALARTRANVPAPAAPSTPASSVSLTAVAPPAGGAELTVSATGYALSGNTATGLPVGWGIAAVDPSVIPLGTHFTVPGYGEAVAADTGGAISGDTIDLWFPTVAQAEAWGRRTVTIVLH